MDAKMDVKKNDDLILSHAYHADGPQILDIKLTSWKVIRDL